MKVRSGALHLGLLVLALLLGLLLLRVAESSASTRLRPAHSARGSAPCVDSTGRSVRCGSFRRMASGSLLADQLLDAVADSDRIIAFSAHSNDRVLEHRFKDRPHVDPNDDPERVLALHPDLLLVNHFVDPGKRRRLEDSGVVVFDLGPMQGADSFLEDLVLVARLAGDERRGQRLADGFRRRFAAVASDVPVEGRPTAAYVAVYGTQIYGGTRNTSFHDVIVASGMIDVEADRYQGWPELTSEVILAMDPDHLITSRGRRTMLCSHPGLSNLRACKSERGVIEIDPGIVDDPGFAMLDAAEQIRATVHGPRREPTR